MVNYTVSSTDNRADSSYLGIQTKPDAKGEFVFDHLDVDMTSDEFIRAVNEYGYYCQSEVRDRYKNIPIIAEKIHTYFAKAYVKASDVYKLKDGFVEVHGLEWYPPAVSCDDLRIECHACKVQAVESFDFEDIR